MLVMLRPNGIDVLLPDAPGVTAEQFVNNLYLRRLRDPRHTGNIAALTAPQDDQIMLQITGEDPVTITMVLSFALELSLKWDDYLYLAGNTSFQVSSLEGHITTARLAAGLGVSDPLLFEKWAIEDTQIDDVTTVRRLWALYVAIRSIQVQRIDTAVAVAWLDAPNSILDGQSPLDFLAASQTDQELNRFTTAALATVS